jgi:hypothetical protein
MRVVARAALLGGAIAISLAGTASADAEPNPNGANCTGVGFSGLATGREPGFVGDEISTYNQVTAAPPTETLGVIRRNTQARSVSRSRRSNSGPGPTARVTIEGRRRTALEFYGGERLYRVRATRR